MSEIRFRRGIESTMPNGVVGEPLYTTDTNKLFIGQGESTPPVPVGAEVYKAGVGGVSQYQFVYIDTTGRVSVFDATNPTFSKAIGIALNSGLENSTIYVLSRGIIKNPLWSLTLGRIYYASNGGGISLNFPNVGIYQQIGVACDTSILSVNIEEAIYIGV
jgi:Major tropism determinant N-terminal domain